MDSKQTVYLPQYVQGFSTLCLETHSKKMTAITLLYTKGSKSKLSYIECASWSLEPTSLSFLLLISHFKIMASIYQIEKFLVLSMTLM